MTAFDPDPNLRWLFCMTHPDDEISICAWIRRLVDAGAEVHVNWTHSTPVREKEARRVAAVLGVSEERLYFMHATDGAVCDDMPGLVPKFESLMARVLPHRVACGAFEQGHLDHDATNWLVNQSFRGPVFEIPFYHPYSRRLQTMNSFSINDGVERIGLSPEEARLKIRVAKAYESQNIWSVLWWYEAWHYTRLRPAQLRKRELMRLQRPTDFRIPYHSAPIRREVEACASWKRWLAALDRANMPP